MFCRIFKAFILQDEIVNSIIMKFLFLSLSFIFSFLQLNAQNDWDEIPVPADAGNGKEWQLQTTLSDNFNYEGKGVDFRKNWVDRYVNGWGGPGLTNFSSNHSNVTGGNLVIRASRNNPNRVYCGVISSKDEVMFPIYMEANMKGSKTPLSSNFWFISEDQVNEIDVNEVYGAQSGFSNAMGTNYHIFQRNPFKDLSNEGKHHRIEGGSEFSDDFHRVGVYWKDAFNLDFYLDGKFVRAMKINDPRNPSVGFNQPMQMIIDIEDHKWRSDAGVVASDAELADDSKNRMYVDWVRMYKPVNKDEISNPPPASDAIALLNVPKTVESSTTFTVDAEYETAKDNMEIYVSLWKEGKWVAAKSEFVTQGKETKKVTITLNEKAAPADDYFFKYHIRPRGTDYKQATDSGQTGNFSVIDNSLSVIDFGKDYNQGFINPITDGLLELKNVPVGTSIKLIAISGQVVLKTVSDNDQVTNIFVNEIASASYILKIGDFKAKHLVIQN